MELGGRGTILFIRLVVPQLVGIATFIAIPAVARARSAVGARIAAVLSTAVVAYLLALSAWGGAELLSAIFIAGFVLGHGMAAAALQCAMYLLEIESAT